MTSDEIHRMFYSRLSQGSENSFTRLNSKLKEESITENNDIVEASGNKESKPKKPEAIKPFTMSYEEFHPLSFTNKNDRYEESLEGLINNKFDEFFDKAYKNKYAEEFKLYRAEKSSVLKNIGRDRLYLNTESNSVKASNNGYEEKIKLQYAHG